MQQDKFKTGLQKSTFFVFGFLLLLVSACASASRNTIDADPLPEQVYFLDPQLNLHHGARVGILAFGSPDYAESAGNIAAESLYRKLLKKNVAVRFFPDFPDEGLLEFARSHRFDLIITGEVKYFLQGGNHQNSRVCQDMRAIEPVGDRFYTAAYAGACTEGRTTGGKDFIFFRTQKRPSPSAEALTRRIALQFANMLTGVSRNP